MHDMTVAFHSESTEPSQLVIRQNISFYCIVQLDKAILQNLMSMQPAQQMKTSNITMPESKDMFGKAAPLTLLAPCASAFRARFCNASRPLSRILHYRHQQQTGKFFKAF